MRNRVLKRLSYLFTGESMSLIMFVFISYLVNFTYPDLHLYSLFSFWSSFLLLEVILLQGSIYWFAKWKRLKRENTLVAPIRLVQRLWVSKKWNLGMITVIPGAFVADYIIWHPAVPLGFVIAGFIYVFAILEYINYFHIQLSYDNRSDINSLKQTKRFKQACLSKEFKRLGNLKADGRKLL
ncbi:general stress protein [Cytobacillus firmus]|uniref:general stress protein n=1 Tax=Cytobacillus firmus TaxID=1399 RepID=UPI0018CF0F67|nr:general stress protein [Cytobacillus firmus]MBG9550424.1 general stress protein [Cytobacillus firmus]MBG9604118.1 general stress protein [Cytobacillus firmus]MDD9311646.1 general stress protein [Cytobacillus firmus]MED1942242.1 general stress protein [Cytobacillus firmus]